MGQKLSKRQGYVPIQAAEKRDCGRLRRAKKPRRRRRGLRFASTMEKRWDQLTVQLRVIVPGVAPADKVREAPDPVYRRYRIWSVQKRSRRCSALLSTPNSSALMPPTCSTVRTCF